MPYFRCNTSICVDGKEKFLCENTKTKEKVDNKIAIDKIMIGTSVNKTGAIVCYNCNTIINLSDFLGYTSFIITCNKCKKSILVINARPVRINPKIYQEIIINNFESLASAIHINMNTVAAVTYKEGVYWLGQSFKNNLISFINALFCDHCTFLKTNLYRNAATLKKVNDSLDSILETSYEEINYNFSNCVLRPKSCSNFLKSIFIENLRVKEVDDGIFLTTNNPFKFVLPSTLFEEFYFDILKNICKPEQRTINFPNQKNKNIIEKDPINKVVKLNNKIYECLFCGAITKELNEDKCPICFTSLSK